MAATLAALNARLLIEITGIDPIEVGTLSIPVEAQGTAFLVASFDMRTALSNALRAAADELDNQSKSIDQVEAVAHKG